MQQGRQIGMVASYGSENLGFFLSFSSFFFKVLFPLLCLTHSWWGQGCLTMWKREFKEYRKSIGADGAKDYFRLYLMHICILKADGWMRPGLIQRHELWPAKPQWPNQSKQDKTSHNPGQWACSFYIIITIIIIITDFYHYHTSS